MPQAHRDAYPEQYTHPLVGRRVRTPAGEVWTVERVVRSRFGPMIVSAEHGTKKGFLVRQVTPLDGANLSSAFASVLGALPVGFSYGKYVSANEQEVLDAGGRVVGFVGKSGYGGWQGSWMQSGRTHRTVHTHTREEAARALLRARNLIEIAPGFRGFDVAVRHVLARNLRPGDRLLAQRPGYPPGAFVGVVEGTWQSADGHTWVVTYRDLAGRQQRLTMNHSGTHPVEVSHQTAGFREFGIMPRTEGRLFTYRGSQYKVVPYLGGGLIYTVPANVLTAQFFSDGRMHDRSRGRHTADADAWARGLAAAARRALPA